MCYVDLWLRGKVVCKGQQLISIEYVTKANHCEAAGRETKVFHHPLVFHLKRVQLWYLHHYRHKLSSSIFSLKTLWCTEPSISSVFFNNTHSRLSIYHADLENSWANCASPKAIRYDIVCRLCKPLIFIITMSDKIIRPIYLCSGTSHQACMFFFVFFWNAE